MPNKIDHSELANMLGSEPGQEIPAGWFGGVPAAAHYFMRKQRQAMKRIRKNVFFESLPKHDYIELVGSSFVWNGHKRGTGRVRAIVCWNSRSIQKACQKLQIMADHYNKHKDMSDDDFKKEFGVSK